MQYFVYIPQCGDDSYYVGSTSDPSQRLQQHLSGRGGTYTSQRLPVSLVFQESQTTLAAAVALERQIKRWSHGKKAALVNGDTTALREKARRRNLRVKDVI